jgi:hypothetical protein
MKLTVEYLEVWLPDHKPPPPPKKKELPKTKTHFLWGRAIMKKMTFHISVLKSSVFVSEMPIYRCIFSHYGCILQFPKANLLSVNTLTWYSMIFALYFTKNNFHTTLFWHLWYTTLLMFLCNACSTLSQLLI